MIELLVTGMTCNGCVVSVRRALERVLPDARADIDLTTGRLRVDVAAADPDRIRAVVTTAIEDAGFGIQA
jgi:copper chaperone